MRSEERPVFRQGALNSDCRWTRRSKVKDLWPPAMTSHMTFKMGVGSREKQFFVFFCLSVCLWILFL